MFYRLCRCSLWVLAVTLLYAYTLDNRDPAWQFFLRSVSVAVLIGFWWKKPVVVTVEDER